MGVRRAVWVILLAGALLTGCGKEEDSELPETFGPGSGGPQANSAAGVTFEFTNAAGTPIGAMTYDGSFFADVTATLPTTNGLFLVLSTPPALTGAGLTLRFLRFTGRADTACRFRAAVLARDQGYTILQSGDRLNSRGLEFHQVDLARGGAGLSLFCVSLRERVGLMVRGEAPSPATLGNLQVHAVLNSIGTF
ncbi:MAG: hypothetical protein IIA14_09070 [SAR324 cluster bacterium]|nr:hypothetical protein [SAR324 cluster bacterium]